MPIAFFTSLSPPAPRSDKTPVPSAVRFETDSFWFSVSRLLTGCSLLPGQMNWPKAGSSQRATVTRCRNFQKLVLLHYEIYLQSTDWVIQWRHKSEHSLSYRSLDLLSFLLVDARSVSPPQLIYTFQNKLRSHAAQTAWVTRPLHHTPSYTTSKPFQKSYYYGDYARW